MGRVLVACEESQAVTIAFRKLGHEAFSCDVQESSGGHPEWHLHGDVKEWLYESWDMIIAHPPCTYLTNTGVRWLVGKNAKEGRWEQLREGAEFFKMFLDHPCKFKAVENPIMHKYAVELVGRKHDQLIQPYMFGHLERKATCLWLDNLPLLKETSNVKAEMLKLPKRTQNRVHWMAPSKDRAKLRSKTYTGVSEAMASQWGSLL